MADNHIDAPIFITSDHAGYEMKIALRDWLQSNMQGNIQGKGNGHGDIAIEILGAPSTDASDYPDDARQLSDELLKNKNAIGIAICGSGIGMAIALNRHNHIRAALCQDVGDATTARQHNNANVLVLAARKISIPTATDIVKNFQETNFASDAERHRRRVDKLL